MVDIVFATPPLAMSERYGALAPGGSKLPPLGLALLASIVRGKEFSTSIVDAEALNLTTPEAARKILDYNPSWIGITAVTMSVHNAVHLAETIKTIAPQVLTILGGVHLTALPQLTMEQFNSIDLGVIGEGEETLVELLIKGPERKNLASIPGLIFRDNEKLKITAPRKLIADLDSLPFPAWDLLPVLSKHYRPAANCFLRLPSSSIISSRGCPGRCIFCDRTISGKRIRTHSARYLIEQIRHLYRYYQIRDIIFHDDNFMTDRKRLLELCQLLRQENLKLSWSCTGRIDMAEPELLKRMKEAGCWQIAYGIESGAQEILNFLKKDITLQQIRETISLTREAGIESRGYFMLGVPGETKETLRETINFLLDLPLDDFHITFFAPHPGSKITANIREYGFFDNDWRKDGGWQVTFIPSGLTREDLEKHHRLAFSKFYFRKRIILAYIKRTFLTHHTLYRLWLAARAFFKYLTSRASF